MASVTTRIEIDTGIPSNHGGNRTLGIDATHVYIGIGSIALADIPKVIESLRLAELEIARLAAKDSGT